MRERDGQRPPKPSGAAAVPVRPPDEDRGTETEWGGLHPGAYTEARCYRRHFDAKRATEIPRTVSMQPNALANLALATYPLFIWAMFALKRPPVALALSLLVSELTLPSLYSLPLSFPAWLNKSTIPSLAAFLPAFIFGRSYFRRSAPFRGVEAFFVLGFVGDFFTMWTNRDPIHWGPVTLPGENIRDVISYGIRSVIVPWSAFYLGRVMFKTSRDLMALTRLLVLSAAIYTIPILIEVKMSPQFSNWFYGYSPVDFQQTMRWGGYRPGVFIGHGLSLSLFMLVCTMMAVALARIKRRLWSLSMKPLCIYLFVVLVLCKSTGSIVYAAALIPLLLFAAPPLFSKVATFVAAVVLLYPLLRFGDILPVEKVGELFSSISTDRAGSLSYRFQMEQQMLDITRARPWFGMGGYGRNFVYDGRGNPTTVVDGFVIGLISTRGIVGFLTFLGPLLFSVLGASRVIRQIKTRSSRILLSALTLCCAVVLFDLIVNSTLPPLFIMTFGALRGLTPGLIAEEAQQARGNAASDAQHFEATAFEVV